MFDCPSIPPSHWEPVFVLEGRQMIRPGAGRLFLPGRGRN